MNEKNAETKVRKKIIFFPFFDTRSIIFVLRFVKLTIIIFIFTIGFSMQFIHSLTFYHIFFPLFSSFRMRNVIFAQSTHIENSINYLNCSIHSILNPNLNIKYHSERNTLNRWKFTSNHNISIVVDFLV